MACDLQATHSSNYKLKVKTKIFEIENKHLWNTPFLVGYSGNVDEVPGVIAYLLTADQTTKPPKAKTIEGLILTKDRKIFSFFGNPSTWIQIDQPYYAIGSGMHFAGSAMECGKTPLEAVKIASKFDTGTGMGFKTFDFT